MGGCIIWDIWRLAYPGVMLYLRGWIYGGMSINGIHI